MSFDELAYLRHMLDEARYLEGKVAGLDRGAFLADPTLQRAFVRSLEIIGEATQNLKLPTFNLKLLQNFQLQTSNLKLPMPYHSFEDLDVWKRACRIAVQIYEVLHKCRDFGLKDQMTRSAISIASNIAEGAERNSKADFVRFLNIAKGSAGELRTQLYIAHRIGLIDSATQTELTKECKEISAMLGGIASTLKRVEDTDF